jgi:dipeptidase
MGCDAVVALGPASVDGQTLLGQNISQPAAKCSPFCRTCGRTFATGEKVVTRHMEISQARQTYTVLGRSSPGRWGYDHGLNEHKLAIACVALHSSLARERHGIHGTDLVRLGLEQNHTARHAVDQLTHLIENYGQGTFPGRADADGDDSAILVADPNEAYVVETAGRFWALQEIHDVRAQSTARVIRQDWDRIASGLAALAIEHGSWPDDGSKLDFAAALAEKNHDDRAARERWRRATQLLQEQSGHIDLSFIRRTLSDEDIQSEIRHQSQDEDATPAGRTAASSETGSMSVAFAAALGSDPTCPAMAWCALGTPYANVFLPVFVDGHLPEVLSNIETTTTQPWAWRMDQAVDSRRPHRNLWASARESLARLQARIDSDTEEFLLECASIKQKGLRADLERQTSIFMEYNWERFGEVVRESFRMTARPGSGARSGDPQAPPAG